MTTPAPSGDGHAAAAGAYSALARTADDFVRTIAAVRTRMADAAARAGRDRGQIRLLPVSKTVDEGRLREAYRAGCRRLAENKVQEAQRKHDALADLEIDWCVIGHLQTNKAKQLAAFAAEFQALDSLHVAEALDRRLQEAGRGLDVFVQVNTSAEATKSGLAPEELPDFLAQLPTYAALRPVGLMTMAANTPDEARVRECFRALRVLRDRAQADGHPEIAQLSMGMSDDFELAIEEGSTVVRVGRAIFGARPRP